MKSRSASPEFSPLAIGEDLTPLPTYKAASTTSISFSNLLRPPLLLHEDLSNGCGGQLWPAGMVLARHMLRYHKDDLKEARMFVMPRCRFSILEVVLADGLIDSLEVGAGGGLVGLAVAIGCHIRHSIHITDQENMKALMHQNISLNHLESRVIPLILNWGDMLPQETINQRPNVILAADCVYFEPAFPLLLDTLDKLLNLSKDVVIYFCFKKRRRADTKFMKSARKKFAVDEVEDEDKATFSREGLFLYTFRKKP